MRINEFKKQLNKLEMQYGHKIKLLMPDGNFNYYRVKVNYQGMDYFVCRIGTDFALDLNTRSHFLSVCHDEDFKRDLFDVIVEFAKTPIDKRREEKRYQYRLKDRYLWIADKFNNEITYLNFRIDEYSLADIALDSNIETNFCKTKFTDKEIKEMAEKYDIDLDMFDKIEVEDE